MMKAKELKAWVATLGDDDIVGVSDGGLCIEVVHSKAYIELGGMPYECPHCGSRNTVTHDDDDKQECGECGAVFDPLS